MSVSPSVGGSVPHSTALPQTIQITPSSASIITNPLKRKLEDDDYDTW